MSSTTLMNVRAELIEKAMKEFERGLRETNANPYAYIAGFYQSIIITLAKDKYSDYEYVLNMLKR